MTEISQELIERQINIERDYRIRGINRSKQLIEKALANNRAHELTSISRLIHSAFETVSYEIEAIKNNNSGNPMAKYRARIKEIDTDILANASLIIVINSICSNDIKNTFSQRIFASLGRMVEAEILNKKLEEKAPAYISRVQEYLKERCTKSPSHILRTYRAAAENVHLENESWDNLECVQVGKLLMACVYSTGLFEWKTDIGTEMYALVPTAEVEEILTDVVTNADTVQVLPPMIVQPNPHTTLFDGGYLTNICRRRTYKNNSISKDALKRVYDAFSKAAGIKEALNKLQNVPYKVNKRILKLVQEARALGIGTGMPSTIPKQRPEWKLDGIPKEEYNKQQLEDFEQWKIVARNWHGEERTRKSRLRGLLGTLELCEEFKDEPELYFPTCVDWRYRVYFKSHLNPQGSDVQKAMLLFANGYPLGESGVFWLKVHIANCYGYDSTLFADRVNWVNSNMDVIYRIYEDPFNTDEWANADSPWCMLAAVIELVEALESGKPHEYISHVPVCLDATNSGAQHFSAMLRDEVGAELTNVKWVGNRTKADLYKKVASIVGDKLLTEKYKPTGYAPEIIDYWIDNPMTRTMSKKPTMTYFYSAKLRSCTDYLLIGALDEGYKPIQNYSMLKLCSVLAKFTHESIGIAMPSSKAGMEYLQELCKRIPKENHLEFKTPLGGLVVNRYDTVKYKRIRINSMGLSTNTVFSVNRNINNKLKSISGVSPNCIHSLDATHLALTVLNYKYDIMPIHDSMGTHACCVKDMLSTIKHSFYELYRHSDPLKDITEAAVKAGADVSDLPYPERGKLNIAEVLKSPFFFC